MEQKAILELENEVQRAKFIYQLGAKEDLLEIYLFLV